MLTDRHVLADVDDDAPVLQPLPAPHPGPWPVHTPAVFRVHAPDGEVEVPCTVLADLGDIVVVQADVAGQPWRRRLPRHRLTVLASAPVEPRTSSPLVPASGALVTPSDEAYPPRAQLVDAIGVVLLAGVCWATFAAACAVVP